MQEDLFIGYHQTVKEALKALDRTARKVLLVVDDGDRLVGTLTDGDIRRYILSGKSLDNDIDGVYNTRCIYLDENEFSEQLAKKLMLEKRIELLPIVNDEKRVVDYLTWDQVFSEQRRQPMRAGTIDIPVVIMAGGKGERLEPITRILPKPLIPIGEKPIIEIVMEEFEEQGVNEFHLILNHRGGMIEAYFNSLDCRSAVNFITEDEFMDTAGGLKLLDPGIADEFIVSNCDVIVRADYCDVLKFHRSQDAVMTILASIHHYKIPYGVLRFKDHGQLVDIVEKPEHTCTVNTGVYILGKTVLDSIPDGGPFSMPDLIQRLLDGKKKVVMYPLNERDYIDIGQWEEYKKAIERLRFLG